MQSGSQTTIFANRNLTGGFCAVTSTGRCNTCEDSGTIRDALFLANAMEVPILNPAFIQFVFTNDRLSEQTPGNRRSDYHRPFLEGIAAAGNLPMAAFGSLLGGD